MVAPFQGWAESSPVWCFSVCQWNPGLSPFQFCSIRIIAVGRTPGFYHWSCPTVSAGPAGMKCLPQHAAGNCLSCCLSSMGMSQLWSRSHLAEQRCAELIRLLPGKVSSLRQNICSTLAPCPCCQERGGKVAVHIPPRSLVCISLHPPKWRTSCKAVDAGQ